MDFIIDIKNKMQWLVEVTKATICTGCIVLFLSNRDFY